MRRIRSGRLMLAVAAAAVSAAVIVPAGGIAGENPKLELPLWPYPHQVATGDGTCDLAGKTICLPAKANEKSQAIAAALGSGLKQYLGLPAVPAVKQEGTSDRPYVLSLGVGPDAWPKAAAKLQLNDVHPTLHEQAYVLEITPQGAVIVSPGSWGLFYGAVTLMQLARCGADGTKVPCATILDWPEIEIRGAHITRAPDDHRRLAGVYAMDGKVNMFVWENFMVAFAGASHPELGGRGASTAAPGYGKIVREVRNMGIEVVPLRNMSCGHCVQAGLYPYVFMGDNPTYFWAMKEVIDSELEVYTPRYFNIGMDEEQYSMKAFNYPNRSLKQWRDVAVEFARHLRRRGVMGQMWSELLFPAWGGKSRYFDWKGQFGAPFPSGYEEFTATFPGDMILIPWFYWTKTPEDTLGDKGDLRRQAKTGLPVMPGANGNNVEYHTAAVKTIKNERPNALGVLTTGWGGDITYQDKYPRYPEYIRRSSGPYWNLAVTGNWTPAEKKAENPIPFWEGDPKIANAFKWPPAKLEMPDLECLFDADAPASVDEALGRLKSNDWRTWITAREQLVAAGLPAAPLLLAAMSKADGDLRDRIEGCLSRNARDSRTGRRRGTLDVSKVTPFLRDGNAAVRDIAAEVVASCADGGAAQLRAMAGDATAGAACCRALGIVRDTDGAKALVAVVANSGAPAPAVAEAARALGLMRIKEAAEPLRAVLRSNKDAEAQKAALWSLALLGCSEAGGDIAALLSSADRDMQFRAAMALTIMRSPETKKLVPWLLEDRHMLEVAAWSMWKSWEPKDAEAALSEAAKAHKDEDCRKRLDVLSKVVMGSKEGRY